MLHNLTERTTMRKPHILLLLPGVVLAAVTLTSCSATEDHSGGTTSKPTSTSAAMESNRCIDDHLTVTDVDAASKAIEAGCGTISFLTDGADVSIGPVETLSIEGSNNVIHGETMRTVHAMGTGNKVTYVGDAPNTDDLGDGNTAEPSSK